MKRAIIIFLILFSISLVSAQLSPSESSDVSVIVDVSPPEVEIIDPKPITYNNAIEIPFKFSVSDLSLDTTWYSLNGADNVTYLGEFSLPLLEGDHSIIAYANDSSDRLGVTQINFTIDNSVSFCGNNFCSTEETCSSCVADCGICPPANDNGGSGGGGGGGGRSTGKIVFLDKDLIVVTLVKGIPKTETITITNPNSRNSQFNLIIEELESFVTLIETSFTLSSRSSKEIALILLARESEPAGLYAGRIIVNSRTNNDWVNIVLQVTERRTLFDIISKLKDNTLTENQKLKATITMTDIGNLEEVDISLEYFIKDFKDNEIKIGQEDIKIDGNLEIEREFNIPKSLTLEEYVFYTKLSYKDSIATSANPFSLVKKESKYILVLIIILALIIFFALWKNKNKKKHWKKT